MTRTKSEQIVKEAVIQAVPEILELKFGCEVEYLPLNELDFKYIGTFVKESRESGNWLVHYPYTGGSQHPYTTTLNPKYFKVLGRPIRLADVLLAISGKCDRSCKTEHNPNEHMVSEDDWGLNRSSYDVAKLLVLWNLRTDSLSEQSDETIHFLAELFSKEE